MIYYCDNNGVLKQISKVYAKNPSGTNAVECSKFFIGSTQVLGEISFLYEKVCGDASQAKSLLTIPYNGKYRITCIGRGGYSKNNGIGYPPENARIGSGGSGACAIKEVSLTADTVLVIWPNGRIYTDGGYNCVAVEKNRTALVRADDGHNASYNSSTGLMVGGTGGSVFAGDASLSTRGNNGTEAHIPDDIGEMSVSASSSVGTPWGYGVGGGEYLNNEGYFHPNYFTSIHGNTMNGYIRIERIGEYE